MSFIYSSREKIYETKKKIESRQGDWEHVCYELEMKGRQYLQQQPVSVTYFKSPSVSSDPHDFYSEAPYWWPDTENPDGPFIRRDGERYPGRFVLHDDSMTAVADAVSYLAMAGFYLNRKDFSDHAALLLDVWFNKKETRMNPNLNYSQAIHGICEGRYIGIIETTQIMGLIHGVNYLSEDAAYSRCLNEYYGWCDEFLYWLINSDFGIQERRHGNNHGIWCNTQIASYAALLDKKAELEEAFLFHKESILPVQMEKDGSLPEEIARTRSIHYSLFALNGCALLCEIAYRHGVDLWNYRTPDGKCMEKGLDFLLPYMDNPFLWKQQVVDGEVPDAEYCFHVGAERLERPDYAAANAKRGKDKYLIRGQKPIGPLVLL